MDIVRRSSSESVAALVNAGVHPVLARVYAARGIASTDDLVTALDTLPPFASMRGIAAAATRLADAIAASEPILIVADYDADGATACAVGVRGLRAMGASVDFLVPNRFEYGYGLTPEIVDQAALRAPRLIVTVDNGIGSHDGVARATAHGIEVLITDHHLPAATLPTPALIVDPNQPGCAFPGKDLAGVGVMFYVLIATRAELRRRGGFSTRAEPNLAALLDLVALGTVADVVRLDRLNRTLVSQGLSRLRAGRGHPGIAALFSVAGRDVRRASAFDLGYVAGPRLNAAGRLADMSIGIRCLLADTAASALPLASELDRLNRERREVEATMQDEALAALADGEVPDAAGAYSLCLYRADWHPGVVGIVAGRLRDRFHRPAIVFACAGDTLKGSGRSIDGLHLRDSLDLVAKRTPGLIGNFGGHARAAGLALPESHLPAFTAAFEAVAREKLTPDDLRMTLATDGSLAAEELDLPLADHLQAQVWGQGFTQPLFDDRFDVADQRIVGGRHSRLVLTRDGRTFGGILFDHIAPMPAAIHAAYRPEANEWDGLRALQIVVAHWRAA